MPAGKGDKPRPVDKKKWDEGWERIFGNKINKQINKNDDIIEKDSKIEKST